jgi:hypothetical protein
MGPIGGSVGLGTLNVQCLVMSTVKRAARAPSIHTDTPIGWQGLALESEYIILNSVPSGSVLRKIPAFEVSPLTVNGQGLLVPGTRVP